MNESQVTSALSALAQTDRLRIARFLVKRGPIGAPAGLIAKQFAMAPSRLSFHLAALEKGGLVSKTRQSQRIIYVLNFEAMRDLTSFLGSECCSEMDADCPTC